MDETERNALWEERLRGWIDRYADALLKTCYVMLRDKMQAEDAVQDTFLKAWRHIGRFDKKEIANERAWLVKIAVNTCRDYARKPWFRHVDRRVPPEELPPRLTGAEDENFLVAEYLCGLPEEARQVLMLHYYHGMTVRETAEALSISTTAAHRRLKKAEDMLKDRAGEGWRNDE